MSPAVALATGSPLLAQASGAPQVQSVGTVQSQSSEKSKKLVEIQIGARSFVDEGMDKCLDTLQNVGGVNTVFATAFTYGPGLADRQVHNERLPNHGVKEYDQIHSRSFTNVHPKFYAESAGIETRCAIAYVGGTIPIYPGIDVDIPTGLGEKRAQPEDVKAATLAALRAGAPGVTLSRKYAERKLTNIAGAREALREFGA